MVMETNIKANIKNETNTKTLLAQDKPITKAELYSKWENPVNVVYTQ